MKKILFTLLASSIVLASPALAKPKHHGKAMHHSAMSKAMPTQVSVDGKMVDVCSATKMDSCINPREAGLKYGNNPMGDWPGHPASEKKH